MKSPLALLLFAPLVAASAQIPATPALPGPALPDPHSSTSCPIRADQAYLSMQPGPPVTHPGQEPQSTLTLHGTVSDNEAKNIRSYTVHARIATTPAGSFDTLPHASEITRNSRGILEAGTPKQLDWSFPAAHFTTRLQNVWFDKVLFSDGTTWNKTPGDGCTFRATGHIVQTRH